MAGGRPLVVTDGPGQGHGGRATPRDSRHMMCSVCDGLYDGFADWGVALHPSHDGHGCCGPCICVHSGGMFTMRLAFQWTKVSEVKWVGS
jgi:hypothetical protein